MQNENLISYRINNLNLWYGEKQALHDCTLEIEKSTVTALIGPSGCGKSTFLKTLNRMHDINEAVKINGNILFHNKDIYSYNVLDLRKTVGMVFQKPNPFPLSIYDNIAFGPSVHKIKNKAELDNIVESSLKKAALWDEVKDRLKMSALSLSGGQQQRLCIARALATNPEVILMDEPTSALDPIATLKIEELIGELKQQYTIIIVTHNMEQAGRAADKVAFFLNGVIVEYDTTDKIFENPAKKETEDYITGRFG